MANEKHTAQIVLEANATGAEAAIQKILDKLDRATEKARAIGAASTGDGASPGAAATGGLSTSTSTAHSHSKKSPGAVESTAGGTATAAATGTPAQQKLLENKIRWAGITAKADADLRYSDEMDEWRRAKSTAEANYNARQAGWNTLVAAQTRPAAPPTASTGWWRQWGPMERGWGGRFAGAAGGAAGGVVMGGAFGGPGGMISGAGQGLGGMIRSIGDAIPLPGAKMVASTVGATLAVGGALIGGSYALRGKMAGELQALERNQAIAQLSGSYFGGGSMMAPIGKKQWDQIYRRAAEQHGYSPMEYAQALADAGVGLGVGGIDQNTQRSFALGGLAAQRMGMSASPLYAYGRLFARGGGARGTMGVSDVAASGAMGAIQRLGMTGARADAAMSGLVGMVESRRAAGLHTRLGGYGGGSGVIDFIAGMANSPNLSLSGEMGLGAVNSVMGIQQSARAAFTNNFAGLGQAAVLGSALSGATSIEEAMARLGGIDTPQKVLRAMRDTIGAKGAKYALFGQGIGAAGDLMAVKPHASYDPDALKALWPGTQTATETLYPLTREQALRQVKRIEAADPEQSKMLIQLMGNIEQSLILLTQPGGMLDNGLSAINEKLGLLVGR